MQKRGPLRFCTLLRGEEGGQKILVIIFFHQAPLTSVCERSLMLVIYTRILQVSS